MKFNLEWVKKHPYAVAGGALAVFVVIYLISRNSGGGGGGFAGALAAQNANQASAAQLNAQLSAQSEQTQAQLAGQVYSIQAQNQQQQNAELGQLAQTILPIQFESSLYEQELASARQEQTALLPYIGQALNLSGKGNRAQTGQNELALLLGVGNPALVGYAGGLPVQGANNKPAGFSLGIPGLGSLGVNLGTGLFG